MAAILLMIILFVAPADAEPRFEERSEALGVDFVHRHFGTGEKLMPENMGPGVAIFDADGDDRLDIYLVQGAPLGKGDESAPNRLFRQRDDGTFEDATGKAGVGDRGAGMGVAFGDVDRDGDLDLYVTNYGPNVLYENRGDGTFEDVTAKAGVAAPGWSTSAGFFDADGDGDLDLFVVHYLDWTPDENKWCGNAQTKLRAYCHPDVYDGAPDLFFRNDGTGIFTEVSLAAGIKPSPDAKGLGVAMADLDGDGHQDVYVANDSTMNSLYAGDGKGTFRDVALLAGVGLSGAGAAEASMGVEIADWDGDGRAEIFLTHLDQETNTLYRPAGDGLYADATAAAGLAGPSLPWVGFGTVALDHDHDGDLDLAVTNGHIIDNIARFDPARSHRQPAQLFDNVGDGRFVEIADGLGAGGPLVGRGAARGDLDRDGDLDLVLTQNDGPARVLLNRRGDARPAIAVALRGTRSNPQGFGARLELTAGKRRQTRILLSSSSYLSQSAPEAHFGLGENEIADQLVVFWPSGQIDRHENLRPGFFYRLTEGAKTVDARPLGRAAIPPRTPNMHPKRD